MFRPVFACFLASVVLSSACGADGGKKEYAFEKGIPYLPNGGVDASEYAREKCRLDLYYPEAGNGFPTIVFYHGGGLRNGTRGVPRPLRYRGDLLFQKDQTPQRRVIPQCLALLPTPIVRRVHPAPA